MPAPRSPRAMRVAATRAKIAGEAQRLFEERGFDSTSVADVAAASGVAVQTVFNHVSSKEALFFLDRTPFISDLVRPRLAQSAGAWADALVQHLADTTLAYVSSLQDPTRLVMAAQIERTPSLAQHERVILTEAEDELAAVIKAHLPGTHAPLAAALLLATTRVHAVGHRRALLAHEVVQEAMTAIQTQLPDHLARALDAARKD